MATLFSETHTADLSQLQKQCSLCAGGWLDLSPASSQHAEVSEKARNSDWQWIAQNAQSVRIVSETIDFNRVTQQLIKYLKNEASIKQRI